MRSYFEQISNKRLKINLLVLAHIGLPLYSISDDKIRPYLFFNPPLKKLSTPTSSLTPPPTKIIDPHLHLENSITAYNFYKCQSFFRPYIITNKLLNYDKCSSETAKNKLNLYKNSFCFRGASPP